MKTTTSFGAVISAMATIILLLVLSAHGALALSTSQFVTQLINPSLFHQITVEGGMFLFGLSLTSALKLVL
jgi:hypothetical protein